MPDLSLYPTAWQDTRSAPVSRRGMLRRPRVLGVSVCKGEGVSRAGASKRMKNAGRSSRAERRSAPVVKTRTYRLHAARYSPAVDTAAWRGPGVFLLRLLWAIALALPIAAVAANKTFSG